MNNDLKYYYSNYKAKLRGFTRQKEIDTLYQVLYEKAHDLDESDDFFVKQTERSFSLQWEEFPEGQALLSDPWFRENVARIISEEEIQIKPGWFKGKNVLDAGCGNGRWSYGFAKLGAHVTAVDVNQSAIDSTREALMGFDVNKEFYRAPLEDIPALFPGRRFDVVFCWGVLHHCRKFLVSLTNLVNRVADGGVLYLYLYGRDSVAFNLDLLMFKKRLYYNTLPDKQSKLRFLLREAGGDRSRLHIMHDIYSPLINRRLDRSYITGLLKVRGLEDVVQTIDHTELFIRAIRSNSREYYEKWVLPKKSPPYWFERYR